MKIIFSILAMVISTQTFAHVSECNQTEKLSCEVKYLVKSEGRLQVRKEVAVASYELMDWDEPSLAYCQALVGFNKNKIYIMAGASDTNTVSIAIRHNGQDVTKLQRPRAGGAQADATFSPQVELSRGESLVSAKVTCKLAE